jgi:hypothetical protein
MVFLTEHTNHFFLLPSSSVFFQRTVREKQSLRDDGGVDTELCKLNGVGHFLRS